MMMQTDRKIAGIRPSIVCVLDHAAGFYIGLMLASGGLWVVSCVATFLRAWGVPI